MLIQASRTRSAVGLTRASLGTASRRPPTPPPPPPRTRPRRSSWPASADVRREGAEASLQRRVAVPLVAFQAERRVDRPVAQPGDPIGPLESDRREPSGAVVEHALEVPVAHPSPPG